MHWQSYFFIHGSTRILSKKKGIKKGQENLTRRVAFNIVFIFKKWFHNDNDNDNNNDALFLYYLGRMEKIAAGYIGLIYNLSGTAVYRAHGLKS